MNSKKILLFFAFLLSSFIGKTQNLPREFYFSGDGNQLLEFMMNLRLLSLILLLLNQISLLR
jgi:hypothetical protein